MPIDALLKSAEGKAALTGLLGGAAGGAIAGSLTKSKTAKKILKTGGLMAVGGLALKAWQVHSANKDAAASEAPVQTAPVQNAAALTADIPVREENAEEASLIVQFMIAAAHADGVLTPEEQNKIWQQAVESKLPSDELAILSSALKEPMAIEQLATLPSNMEEKIEVFTAAAVVIEDDCQDGHLFLNQLGAALDLPSGLTNALLHQLR